MTQNLRNTDADLARQLMRLFVGFDPTQDQAGEHPPPSATFAARLTHAARDYLGTNEDDWLFTRPIALDLLQDLGDGAIILHGERGTGKSSLLRSIWRKTNPDIFRGHLALVDLIYIETQVNNMPPRGRKTYIRNYIFGQLRLEVLPRAYDAATEALLNWTLVTQRPEFEPFLTFLEVRGRQPAFASPAELTAVLQAESDFRDIFNKCRFAYRHAASRFDQDMERLQAFARTPAASSTISAFDNVDRLDPKSQTDVASIARSISTSTKYQLPIIISCRTENVAQFHELVDTIKAVSIPCSPLPTEFEGGVIGWDVREIFQLRIDILTSNALWSHFQETGLDEQRLTSVRREVNLLARRIKEAFDLVWVDRVIASGSTDDPLIELVTTLTE